MKFTLADTCVEDARVVSCPSCAFAFDEAQTDVDGGGYSCPVCSDKESLAALQRAWDAHLEAKRLVMVGDVGHVYEAITAIGAAMIDVLHAEGVIK